MKRIKIFLLLFFLATGLLVNAQRPTDGNNGNHYGQITNGNNGQHKGKRNFGAPLDGGLLTVLGAAGVAYYAARKKSKKLDS